MKTTEEKFDYIERNYTQKIQDYEKNEDRSKKAKEMLDQASKILESDENYHYKNLKFIESRLTWSHNGENFSDKEDIIRKYNTYQIRPEAKIIYFRLPESNSNMAEAFDEANYYVIQGDGKCQNLYEPLPVKIDYDVYSNETFFNNSFVVKRYKDGILLVMRGNKFVNKYKNHLKMMVIREEYEDNETIGDVMKLLSIDEHTLRTVNNIDWTEDCFKDKLTLYILDRNISKTKGVKINIQNHHINKNIKRLKELRKEKFFNLPYVQAGIEKGSFKGRSGVLFDKFYDLIEEGQWFYEKLKNGSKDFVDKLTEHYQINNDDLLRIGWKLALKENYNSIYNIENIFKDSKKNNFFQGLIAYSSMKPEEIQKEFFKVQENISKINKLILTDCGEIDSDLRKEYIDRARLYSTSSILKTNFILYNTNEGTSWGDNKIVTDEMSPTDCLLFWREFQLIDCVSLDMHKFKRCPLVLKNDKVLNNLKIHDDEVVDYLNTIINKQGLKKVNFKDILEQFNFNHKHLLKEAMEQSSGYCFHETGFFPIIGDSIFKGIRFREMEDTIYINLLDENERFITEIFDKKKCDFIYSAYNKFKISNDYLKECMEHIYFKITGVIRDFKIVHERDKVLKFSGYRRPRGLNTNTRYEVYLPRYRYIKNDRSREQIKREKDFEKQNKIFAGSRSAHVRKLPSGYKPSKVQMLLAKKMNVYLPPDYTFVKESRFGENGISKREVIYRSKSLHGVFYYTKSEQSEFDKINEMSSAGFEEYCHKIIEKNNWKIYKNTPVDGGIDIRALKEDKHGNVRTLLVQCKLWRKPIPPGSIRDFKAGCDEENVEGEKELMFITFSKFSSGATEYANKHNIMLVDGDHLLEKKIRYS